MWTHRNHQIDVDMNGRFVATVEGVEISSATLAEARQQIDREVDTKPKKQIALRCVAIVEGEAYSTRQCERPRVMHVTVNGVNRTTRALQVAEALPKGMKMSAGVLPDTPENEAFFVRRLELQAAMQESDQRLLDNGLRVGGYGRVSIEDYDELLAALEKAYQKESAK